MALRPEWQGSARYQLRRLVRNQGARAFVCFKGDVDSTPVNLARS